MNELIAARNSCEICVKRHPGRIFNGADSRFARYTGGSAHFSYWSQWLGDPNPDILIVGQDFGGTDYVTKVGFQDKPGNQTNAELHRLLGVAGVKTSQPPTPDVTSGVFLTNSILCIKEGSLADPILTSWVNSCSDVMLRPLLGRLRPKLVVALGAHAWKSVRRRFGLRSSPSGLMKALALQTHWVSEDGTVIFCMAHCSQLGRRSRSGVLQEDDWRRFGAVYARETKKWLPHRSSQPVPVRALRDSADVVSQFVS